MDRKQEDLKTKYGLIGKDIEYSFSRAYFNNKFKAQHIDAEYLNFDLKQITDFPLVLIDNPSLKGLNVTVPYKELIIPYLDKLDKKAKRIAAVNTIKITKKGKLKGYNTDYYGFKESIRPLLRSHHKSALILGTGGASKAICYALKKLGIDFKLVSRKASKNTLTYKELSKTHMSEYKIIINCTPIGTIPNIDDCPELPYEYLTESHLLYDLVYNPEETEFLKLGKFHNAQTMNGLSMLRFQAEKAWSIWTH